ncbi:hypothetical protein [Planococcus halotolerans]|nr:hypothetical protein [Planococcus halotolerans]
MTKFLQDDNKTWGDELTKRDRLHRIRTSFCMIMGEGAGSGVA